MVDTARRWLTLQADGPSRPAAIAFWALVLGLLALSSLWMNRVSGGAPVMWLPNAVALARVLTLPASGRPGDMLAALGLGTAFAHALAGVPPHMATALGLVHMLEVGAGALLYQKVLFGRLPHDDEVTYLRFVAAVALPAAAIAAIPGGVLLTLENGENTTRAALGWLMGNAVGIAGFTPLAVWLASTPERRYRTTLREMQWTASALTMLLTVLGVALALQQEVQGILLAILLTSLFALRTGRVGVMILSVVLVPTLSVTGVLERDLLLGSGDGLGLGTEMGTFAAVYTCMVLPSNLIAAMIARLQMAERTQRDIAAMKVQFLSTMSHEIKTPMNAIHGMFELFSRSELTDRQRRWADAGLSASRNLQAQVTQILEMARLEENTIQVKPRPVDPRKLLQNWIVTTEAGILVSGKSLSVHGQAAENVPGRVLIDESRVQQILVNLLTNAVKFSDEGQIGIAMRAVRGALVIEVSDTGIGIAPEDQGLVFERFWQVDSGADRRRDGTGLGLAISRELAQLMGGSLTLRSDPGQGSTFRLTLPLIAVPAEGGR